MATRNRTLLTLACVACFLVGSLPQAAAQLGGATWNVTFSAVVPGLGPNLIGTAGTTTTFPPDQYCGSFGLAPGLQTPYESACAAACVAWNVLRGVPGSPLATAAAPACAGFSYLEFLLGNVGPPAGCCKLVSATQPLNVGDPAYTTYVLTPPST